MLLLATYPATKYHEFRHSGLSPESLPDLQWSASGSLNTGFLRHDTYIDDLPNQSEGGLMIVMRGFLMGYARFIHAT